VQRFEELKKQTDEAVARWADLQKADVTAFQKLAIEKGVPPVAVPAATSAISAGENEP
jgi:hypothetical protein